MGGSASPTPGVAGSVPPRPAGAGLAPWSLRLAQQLILWWPGKHLLHCRCPAQCFGTCCRGQCSTFTAAGTSQPSTSTATSLNPGVDPKECEVEAKLLVGCLPMTRKSHARKSQPATHLCAQVWLGGGKGSKPSGWASFTAFASCGIPIARYVFPAGPASQPQQQQSDNVSGEALPHTCLPCALLEKGCR
ncbi:UNVERIFIED_CONTAM: hypothetical protein K2H54_042675 [Gekko kuhli]